MLPLYAVKEQVTFNIIAFWLSFDPDNDVNRSDNELQNTAECGSGKCDLVLTGAAVMFIFSAAF